MQKPRLESVNSAKRGLRSGFRFSPLIVYYEITR